MHQPEHLVCFYVSSTPPPPQVDPYPDPVEVCAAEQVRRPDTCLSR